MGGCLIYCVLGRSTTQKNWGISDYSHCATLALVWNARNEVGRSFAYLEKYLLTYPPAQILVIQIVSSNEGIKGMELVQFIRLDLLRLRFYTRVHL